MELVITLLAGLLLGGGVGALLGWNTARAAEPPVPAGESAELLAARHAQALAEVRHDEAAQRAALEHRHAAERADLERRLVAERSDVERQHATVAAEVTGLREQLAVAQEQYRDLIERHRREAADRQAAEASESKVLQQLAPVAAQLRQMHQKVEDLEKQRSAQHGSLAEQLRASHEAAEKSRLAAETLSRALRNNTVRGAYGETQLTSLVESAGLVRGVDFSTQESITADSGARRPDMVITLPGHKQMAIDAKVPFNAFIEAHEDGLDDTRRTALLTAHAKAVRAHVDALSHKEYWSGLSGSAEFTVAFIPNDAILNTAVDADPSLMEYAFGKGIVLATPVNLWSVLKSVAFTRRQEHLAENAIELVELGRELYKRLGKMSGDVAKLGRTLESSVKAYNVFVGSLEGRVLVTARKLDRVDTSPLLEEVHEIEADPRALTASELTGGAEFALMSDLERPELDFTDPAAPDERRGGLAG